MNMIEKRLQKLEAKLAKPKVEKYHIQIINASDYLAGKRNFVDFHIDNRPVGKGLDHEYQNEAVR